MELSDINVSCRFCSKYTNFALPIFSGHGLRLQIQTRVQLYFQIILFENYELFRHICYKCLSNLDVVQNIVYAIQTANEIYLKQMQSNLDSSKQALQKLRNFRKRNFSNNVRSQSVVPFPNATLQELPSGSNVNVPTRSETSQSFNQTTLPSGNFSAFTENMQSQNAVPFCNQELQNPTNVSSQPPLPSRTIMRCSDCGSCNIVTEVISSQIQETALNGQSMEQSATYRNNNEIIQSQSNQTLLPFTNIVSQNEATTSINQIRLPLSNYNNTYNNNPNQSDVRSAYNRTLEQLPNSRNTINYGDMLNQTKELPGCNQTILPLMNSRKEYIPNQHDLLSSFNQTIQLPNFRINEIFPSQLSGVQLPSQILQPLPIYPNFPNQNIRLPIYNQISDNVRSLGYELSAFNQTSQQLVNNGESYLAQTGRSLPCTQQFISQGKNLCLNDDSSFCNKTLPVEILSIQKIAESQNQGFSSHNQQQNQHMTNQKNPENHSQGCSYWSSSIINCRTNEENAQNQTQELLSHSQLTQQHTNHKENNLNQCSDSTLCNHHLLHENCLTNKGNFQSQTGESSVNSQQLHQSVICQKSKTNEENFNEEPTSYHRKDKENTISQSLNKSLCCSQSLRCNSNKENSKSQSERSSCCNQTLHDLNYQNNNINKENNISAINQSTLCSQSMHNCNKKSINNQNQGSSSCNQIQHELSQRKDNTNTKNTQGTSSFSQLLVHENYKNGSEGSSCCNQTLHDLNYQNNDINKENGISDISQSTLCSQSMHNCNKKSINNQNQGSLSCNQIQHKLSQRKDNTSTENTQGTSSFSQLLVHENYKNGSEGSSCCNQTLHDLNYQNNNINKENGISDISQSTLCSQSMHNCNKKSINNQNQGSSSCNQIQHELSQRKDNTTTENTQGTSSFSQLLVHENYTSNNKKGRNGSDESLALHSLSYQEDNNNKENNQSQSNDSSSFSQSFVCRPKKKSVKNKKQTLSSFFNKTLPELNQRQNNTNQENEEYSAFSELLLARSCTLNNKNGKSQSEESSSYNKKHIALSEQENITTKNNIPTPRSELPCTQTSQQLNNLLESSTENFLGFNNAFSSQPKMMSQFGIDNIKTINKSFHQTLQDLKINRKSTEENNPSTVRSTNDESPRFSDKICKEKNLKRNAEREWEEANKKFCAAKRKNQKFDLFINEIDDDTVNKTTNEELNTELSETKTQSSNGKTMSEKEARLYKYYKSMFSKLKH